MSTTTDLGLNTFFLIMCFVLFILSLIEYLEAIATGSTFSITQTQVATGILSIASILLLIAVVRFTTAVVSYHNEQEAAAKKKT
jgi:membrane protein implicated in regulation of membrane protease activity